ncbi:MAG: hypothetical protein COA82_01790 [Alkaliphilus sp.]|nr:site-2 protease family protein [bacterium AH-315-G05]PHS36334.1 MAG: hypothetical protein COA82_01790 [Alkaliphilus sp.]
MKKIWEFSKFFLVGGVLGLIIGVFDILTIIERMLGVRLDARFLLVSIVFFLISIFINTSIHEFGHFFIGKIFGYKLMAYSIGMLYWGNENGKMKFSIRKYKDYAGFCAMIAPDQDLPNYKHGLYFAGGIIFNAVSGLGFLMLAVHSPNISEVSFYFLIVLGIVALFFGAINLLPLSAGNTPLDGKIIWSLVLQKPFAKQLLQVNKITAQLAAGVRPRDLNITSVDNTSKLQLFDILATHVFYFKALDSGNIEKMHYYMNLLEKNIEDIPFHALTPIYYELCYIACISSDEEKARKYYEKAGEILQQDKDSNGLRIKAYYEYYINNNFKEAMELCENAIAVLEKFPIKGQKLMEKDLLENLIKTTGDMHQ